MSNLKVGDKVQLLEDINGFTKEQVVEVFWLFNDGQHLFKGANTRFKHCAGQEGAWLEPKSYKLLPSTPAHPHADLMLKYAQIAQYDDKPWEQFEWAAPYDKDWSQSTGVLGFHSNIRYRLKPQPPVVQVGQTWVNLNTGKRVKVFRKPYPSECVGVTPLQWVIGTVVDDINNIVTSKTITEHDLITHFKRKE